MIRIARFYWFHLKRMVNKDEGDRWSSLRSYCILQLTTAGVLIAVAYFLVVMALIHHWFGV